MISTPFEYIRASSVDEVVQLLSENPDAKILAGGHSLVPAMKFRLADPEILIDVSEIGALKGVRRQGGYVVLGALATHRQVETDADVLTGCPALAEAAKRIGDPQVRNRGTIGGSLAHADPAADYPALVLAYDAKITIAGPDGKRSVAADDFFLGMFTTALEEGEMITSVSFPTDDTQTAAGYAKFPNPASRYAVVGVAARLTRNEKGICTAARVGITGAAPSPFRSLAIEEALVGKVLDEETIQEAAAAADQMDDSDYLSDLAATAEYRAHLVKVMAARALRAAVARLG